MRFIWISLNSHFLPTNDGGGGGKHGGGGGPAAFVGLLGEDVIRGPDGVAKPATPEKRVDHHRMHASMFTDPRSFPPSK